MSSESHWQWVRLTGIWRKLYSPLSLAHQTFPRRLKPPTCVSVFGENHSRWGPFHSRMSQRSRWAIWSRYCIVIVTLLCPSYSPFNFGAWRWENDLVFVSSVSWQKSSQVLSHFYWFSQGFLLLERLEPGKVESPDQCNCIALENVLFSYYPVWNLCA
jgi:hypothetical protein